MRPLRRTVLMLLALVGAATAAAEVRLPRMLSDHAVLQRERPIHLWGWATPGAQLTVRFNRQAVPGCADDLGRWSVYLSPEPAGGPYVLTIRGDGPETRVTDLLVGDVWFASGQSNMEMPLSGFPNAVPPAVVKDAGREMAAARNPRLRLLLVEHKSSDIPKDDITATWTECTPETAASFSAVAYFFGRDIASRENVPVGLIDATWGGTPADSWVSLDALGSDPALLPAFASRAAFADQQVNLDAVLAAEQRADAAARAAHQPAPTHPWHPSAASWLPGGLYNAMIAPFTPMTVKGFLWYQGETNSSHDRAPFYGALFRALIADWREHFMQGLLPFLYVQISSFFSPGEDWGMVREQQRRTLAVANTAMAVSLDLGLAGNVHPPDKQTVAARLALAARNLVYAEPVAYRGPLFRQATAETAATGETALRVWFDYADGLSFHGRPATAFEIAGNDRRFVPAEARIDGQTVVVHASSVPHPLYVRFGWASVVPDSLYNAAGLPASTFTSEPKPICESGSHSGDLLP